MNDIIVRTSRGVTLLGGGKARPSDLSAALRCAPCLVAADGGAGFALEQGLVPEAVVGDMDSLSPEARGALPPDRLHRISDQNSTDFDKALRSVEAPLVLGVGFLGRRVDHQLANLNVLVRRAGQPCILIGKHDVILPVPPRITLDLPPGCRVSLFPMTEVTGRSRGLHWPIDGLAMAPGGCVGTSNRVAAAHVGPVTLDVDRPGLLLILPRTALEVAVRALWPEAPPACAK